jgi:hypothetical protein
LVELNNKGCISLEKDPYRLETENKSPACKNYPNLNDYIAMNRMRWHLNKKTMNKTLILSLLLTIGSTALFAQSNRALGIRSGGGFGFGGELSYQTPFKSNRMEFGLGWANRGDYNGFSLTGIYQFVQPLDQGFNWYYGVGAGIGTYNRYRNKFNSNNQVGRLGILGQIGVEYLFDFPLQLSLDARPGIFTGYGAGFGIDVAIGARIYF